MAEVVGEWWIMAAMEEQGAKHCLLWIGSFNLAAERLQRL